MIRLALRVPRSNAELVLAELLELAPSGVEEIELPAHDGGEDVVEYAVYGAPGELPDLPDLQAAAGGVTVEVSSSEIPDDWSERWKQFHSPVLVEPPACAPSTGNVPALRVRPPWEAPSKHSGTCEIVIDPAQAFGTGAHATTRLCLELLLKLAASDNARGAVLDVGAGSGVLAIAAVKLGYGPVLALDNDPESVRAIIANAAVNGVEIDARCFDLRREALPGLAWDRDEDDVPTVPHTPATSEAVEGEVGGTVVLANLLLPLLLELADTMPVLGSSGHLHLIASGLLCEQADEAAQAFAKRLGLSERARREQAGWSALWLTSAREDRSPRAPSP